jgi:hypothetical protein
MAHGAYFQRCLDPDCRRQADAGPWHPLPLTLCPAPAPAPDEGDGAGDAVVEAADLDVADADLWLPTVADAT